MDFLLLLRRAALVFLVVGTGAGCAVYFFHDWYHQSLIPRLGISAPLGDALGTIIVTVDAPRTGRGREWGALLAA